jgi:hypothetical protein
MTDTTAARSAAGGRSHAQVQPEVTKWAGWVIFAGILMTMIGVFHGIEGLVAILRDNYYLVGKNGMVVEVDYTAWGWIHLITGVVLFAAGLGVQSGQMWARVVGVVVAVLSAIVNFVFIASYPLWSLTLIAMDILVIYALTAHGRETKLV